MSRAENAMTPSTRAHRSIREIDELRRRQEVSESVGSLHAFVDLFDRVHAERRMGLRLLIALNLADVVTTAIFLMAGGREANPVLAPIVNRWWLLVLVKVIVLTAVARGVIAAPARSKG